MRASWKLTLVEAKLLVREPFAAFFTLAFPLGMVIFYLMLLLSGAGLPSEMLPEAIRSFSKFLPLTNVVTLLERLLFGSPLGDHLMEVAVLGGVMMAGVGGSQESGGNCRLTRRLMSGIRPEAGV